jgi:hypothetical protein
LIWIHLPHVLVAAEDDTNDLAGGVNTPVILVILSMTQKNFIINNSNPTHSYIYF